MQQAAVFSRPLVIALIAVSLSSEGSAQFGTPSWLSKLDPILQPRAALLTGRSPVIVRVVDGGALSLVSTLVTTLGGALGPTLPAINGIAADLPNLALGLLAGNPLVARLSFDRPVVGALDRTAPTVGATSVREALGYDGAGVGVAVIDSGITPWHDDLADANGSAQRVDRFVDFVGGRAIPYDDYGHGTHVAGIIAGNGFDSSGHRTGIAPGARLTVLKVLDEAGQGRISTVIAAIGYVLLFRDLTNIRVVNLSVATGVYESYRTDPLTLATQQLVDAGIAVVAAAGNNGRSQLGAEQYGGVTAPGNAPWVITAGASSHEGTIDRSDDTIAPFSSRGPSAVDAVAKPDVVAPGVSIGSLSDPASALYASRASALLTGTVSTSYLPYLALSGTSMATPVVTGTVALMLQANPSLTPNAVKAILQYTSEAHADRDPLTQGAGFLNARGAVELARFLGAPDSVPYPARDGWSEHVIWGNHQVHGGRLTASASAWSRTVPWGAARTTSGQAVTWGELCSSPSCDGDPNPPRWGAACLDLGCRTVTWGGDDSENVVWGNRCGGADCPTAWSTASVPGILLGAINSATVVWGTTQGTTVVWGTSCTDPSCVPFAW
jgi:serine protease AprX